MLDRFQLQHSEMISQEAVGAGPGNVLVAVRDYNTLEHLEHALEHTKMEEKDIVVMTTRLVSGPDGGESELYDENLFTEYEQRLFTKVVALAEKHGKPVVYGQGPIARPQMMNLYIRLNLLNLESYHPYELLTQS
jgi:hypothetical protein